MREMRNMYKMLVGYPEGTRPIGSPKCGLEENIKMDL
jgi:hypothetical protein